jgi:hypothetical protein
MGRPCSTNGEEKERKKASRKVKKKEFTAKTKI